MMVSPPERARARLLKLRRVHRTEGRKKKERNDFSAVGHAENCEAWIISPDVDFAGCAPVRDRAVISIAIPGCSSFNHRSKARSRT